MADSTVIELTLPLTTYEALRQVAQRSHKSEVQIMLEAIEAYLKQLAAIDPLLGLFAEEPELIERATDDAMITREGAPLRLAEANLRSL